MMMLKCVGKLQFCLDYVHLLVMVLMNVQEELVVTGILQLQAMANGSVGFKCMSRIQEKKSRCWWSRK